MLSRTTSVSSPVASLSCKIHIRWQFVFGLFIHFQTELRIIQRRLQKGVCNVFYLQLSSYPEQHVLH
jgi:hypothetical protein